MKNESAIAPLIFHENTQSLSFENSNTVKDILIDPCKDFTIRYVRLENGDIDIHIHANPKNIAKNIGAVFTTLKQIVS